MLSIERQATATRGHWHRFSLVDEKKLRLRGDRRHRRGRREDLEAGHAPRHAGARQKRVHRPRIDVDVGIELAAHDLEGLLDGFCVALPEHACNVAHLAPERGALQTMRGHDRRFELGPHRNRGELGRGQLRQGSAEHLHCLRLPLQLRFRLPWLSRGRLIDSGFRTGGFQSPAPTHFSAPPGSRHLHSTVIRHRRGGDRRQSRRAAIRLTPLCAGTIRYRPGAYPPIRRTNSAIACPISCGESS